MSFDFEIVKYEYLCHENFSSHFQFRSGKNSILIRWIDESSNIENVQSFELFEQMTFK